MSRCLDPQTPPEKAFRGSKHPLTRYLEDFGRLGWFSRSEKFNFWICSTTFEIWSNFWLSFIARRLIQRYSSWDRFIFGQDVFTTTGFAIIPWNYPKKLEKPWITKGLATWQFLGLILSMVTATVLMVDPEPMLWKPFHVQHCSSYGICFHSKKTLALKLGRFHHLPEKSRLGKSPPGESTEIQCN